MNAGNEAKVVATGVCKLFEGPDGEPFDAVDQISMRVLPGELTALVGPDGAGKTTLLRMMAGLMKPDGGQLMVLGTDVALDPQSVQNRISYMPQRFGLYEDLSVQETSISMPICMACRRRYGQSASAACWRWSTWRASRHVRPESSRVV